MQSTVPFLIVVLGYLAFGIWAIIWISKKKKAGEKISLWAKIIIVVVFFSGSSVLISMIEPSPPATPSESVTYYVKPDIANVRECPSASCRVLNTLPQNTELTFPGDLFDKYPDWAEVTFPNGGVGYVSKTVLSEDTVSAGLPPPAGGSSSVGGIVIGPWANIQTTVGESYELHFCEPPAAISGATCGGLADTATNPTGGRPPYSFVKKSGFLPPGMTLELNGTLRGSPTQTGTYNYQLCAKDLYDGEGCQNLAVVVNEDKKSDSSPYVPYYPEEILSKSATIDEYSCNWTKVGEEWVFGHLDDRIVWNGHAAGTATGPVGTDFWLSEGYPPGGSISCGDWDADYENLYCVRGPGQPTQTNWYAIWRSQVVLFDHDPPSSVTFMVKGLTERTENCPVN
ncbi:hypothetical protein A3D62_02820 [Candidatus Kaiserbacteria bacterium RIFCSPHIGHO2_02_FULL_49_11]|uniref:SH3b domain-containing protein n=1 Tax=Candidatus Kaiserbacteria bacterium RIFCSPHIGHO2_02_FULL_49_11 TaxID=1798489 RepID=A0A1F6D130_9BACT|nr:MAG: hypothetical protein A3D62_02820 [Candidatus Kaiserbacteria bacterium RIFCSPHIGHO2_02_FULL_49_11]